MSGAGPDEARRRSLLRAAAGDRYERLKPGESMTKDIDNPDVVHVTLADGTVETLDLWRLAQILAPAPGSPHRHPWALSQRTVDLLFVGVFLVLLVGALYYLAGLVL